MANVTFYLSYLTAQFKFFQCHTCQKLYIYTNARCALNQPTRSFLKPAAATAAATAAAHYRVDG